MFDRPTDAEREAKRKRAYALVDAVIDVDPATASGAAMTVAIEARSELAAVVDGAVVALLPQWETSADWARDGDRSPVTAVVNRTGAHKSAVIALRRTGLDAASMPHVSAAAAAGDLSLAHLSLLTRARKPEVAAVFDRDEELLVDKARNLTADALAEWLLGWRYGALAEAGENEPDSPPDHDSDLDTVRIIRGFAGRGLITMDLTPESLAALVEAIEARVETWRRAGQLTEDTRTWDELRAAALMDLVADGSVSTRHGQIRPLLIVTAKLCDLFDRAGIPADQRDCWSARILGGGPIGQAALRTLIEHANLQLVVTADDGEPLYVGRAKRLATAAMLVALYARAGRGCEFPGCHATHHRSHAHHITWWTNGGTTDLPNLALLCPHHHRLIHQAGFTLIRGPSGLVFTRPDGTTIDPPPFQYAA